MKTKRLSLILALAVCLIMTMCLNAPRAEAATGDVAINATNFPDPNFRAYVSSEIDTDGNGVLSASEIGETFFNYVPGKSIASLNGI